MVICCPHFSRLPYHNVSCNCVQNFLWWYSDISMQFLVFCAEPDVVLSYYRCPLLWPFALGLTPSVHLGSVSVLYLVRTRSCFVFCMMICGCIISALRSESNVLEQPAVNAVCSATTRYHNLCSVCNCDLDLLMLCGMLGIWRWPCDLMTRSSEPERTDTNLSSCDVYVAATRMRCYSIYLRYCWLRILYFRIPCK